MDRVAPVVEILVRELDALVSVDTSCPTVIREASELGAGMINDVRALEKVHCWQRLVVVCRFA
ncbi:hypothetical protein HSBAA_05330 [Vreelandella sulfidaeris]|uniref:Pterin-binding domain-containing protein n=1 Tax=Vreelandella sulfidaeris TaxID=115553 RepID=A0A455U0Y3_9GAMM|nr:hypothetical protein HSBAA_05330 [Halomonas sulfidaeris]